MYREFFSKKGSEKDSALEWILKTCKKIEAGDYVEYEYRSESNHLVIEIDVRDINMIRINGTEDSSIPYRLSQAMKEEGYKEKIDCTRG